MTTDIRTLFVMDPFDTVLIDRDTTFAFMREAQKRRHIMLTCEVGHLGRRMKRGYANAQLVTVHDDQADPIRVLEDRLVQLDELDVIFMRKDPPFDMDYVVATYLLDGVDHDRTLVINRPAGLRDANDKTYMLGFPELIPETIVTRRQEEIVAFIAELGGRCIIKPLDGAGGAGVFLLKDMDSNLTSLIETSTAFGTRHMMCQRFIPEAVKGDKRVILIDGEPVGAVLRVPMSGELRGNIHVGAECKKTGLTERDLEICAQLKEPLQRDGLYFAGIDIIGDYLTEINLTSPTGIQEINGFDEVCLEATMWDWIEAKLAGTR